ncbi:hypothetical protein E4T56_gene3627 [Termitomyces sp. T112]|nr:hypothetical protein E4T56_gene3627 [Termitomyces sp. T112]
MTRSLDPNTAPSPPLQCSAKLPNPRPPSTPTSSNSNTSSADPNSSLINSDAFSAAVDASPEFSWTPKAFPDPRMICFPTDPIRMSLRPIPRLHPTTIDSVQFHQAAAIFSALQSRPVVVPENPYAPFYPGPPMNQYVPRHWTPAPNQAFHAPSISQGIPLGWRHPPVFSTNSNNPRLYPGGYSAVPPNSAYLPPAHYYMYPVPAAAPTPPEPMDNYSPPRMPIPAQAPPSPRQQRVKVYAQQCNKVLCFLCLSPAEFARRTRTLLTNLGYPNTSATPEVWADRLFDFHERYLQGNLSETMQGTLGIDDNLWNELCALVKEIHTSPNPHPFEDPLDPTCSFYQEELNAASSILRNLNPVGGLFNQPAIHTLALSARPRANSVPSAFQTWDQPAISEPHPQWLPPRIDNDNDNRTLSYINEPGNPADEHAPCNRPPQD